MHGFSQNNDRSTHNQKQLEDDFANRRRTRSSFKQQQNKGEGDEKPQRHRQEQEGYGEEDFILDLYDEPDPTAPLFTDLKARRLRYFTPEEKKAYEKRVKESDGFDAGKYPLEVRLSTPIWEISLERSSYDRDCSSDAAKEALMGYNKENVCSIVHFCLIFIHMEAAIMKANNGLTVKINPPVGVRRSWRDVLVTPAPVASEWLSTLTPGNRGMNTAFMPIYWKAPEQRLSAILPQAPMPLQKTTPTGLLVTQAEHSLEVAEAARKKASMESCSIVRRIGREVMGQNHANPLAQRNPNSPLAQRNPNNSLAQRNPNDSLAQRKSKDSMALHNPSMRSRRLMNPIHEVQIFASMPVGIRSKTSKESSNLKRQRRRRNKASKKVEQESVEANVMVAIEKALGDYNDDSTESTTGSLVESEVESEFQENVSTTVEEQFAKLIKQAEKYATSISMSGSVTRSMAKSKESVGGVRRDGSVLLYSSSSSSGESSSSSKSDPRSVTKAVSVMMEDVNDDDQSSNSRQNQQLLEEIASLQEQLKKRDKEMSQLMEQIKGLQTQGKQKVYASPGGSFESPKFTEGNGHFFTSSNMNPMLMAMIDAMVKKQVKKAKEKDDEALRAQTFEGFNDLCTKAHDMELHLSKRRRPRVVDRLETSTAATVETKKGGPIVVGAQKPKETKKATMKERLEKNYSFTDDLVEDMFEDLLEQKLITLPEVKRPHEEGKTTHPKYCPYHRLISHTLRDYFVLKDKIQELFDSKTIELPPLEKMTANPITADDDDDGEGKWIVYQSKGMKKRRNSSSRTKAPFVPKRPRKPKTSKKIKRTKVSTSAAKKKKGPKKQKREELVSNEPLKQSPHIRITLKEFLPEKLQSLE
ncbi:hypothetical protein Vadar_018896 [Vaccinium darrowii]|uniref:Uncharacterized protein n=1 Tax=Vaccinium darrowii TaxID=229202 RepID=A0ACB7ZC41_9ERIC|nr:hypothetical protein Vadar_018896 [Vaccinium darrowii]